MPCFVVVVVVLQLRRSSCREGEAAPLLSLHYLRRLSLERKSGSRCGPAIRIVAPSRDDDDDSSKQRRRGGRRKRRGGAVSISPPRSLSRDFASRLAD